MQKLIRTRPAFGLLEVVLSSALVAVISLALIAALVPSLNRVNSAANRQQALSLAQEGQLAARSLYLQDSALLPAGTYGVYRAGSGWTLGLAPDTAGGFSRSLEVFDLPGLGRQALVRLQWTEGSENSELDLEQVFSYSAFPTP